MIEACGIGPASSARYTIRLASAPAALSVVRRGLRGEGTIMDDESLLTILEHVRGILNEVTAELGGAAEEVETVRTPGHPAKWDSKWFTFYHEEHHELIECEPIPFTDDDLIQVMQTAMPRLRAWLKTKPERRWCNPDMEGLRAADVAEELVGAPLYFEHDKLDDRPEGRLSLYPPRGMVGNVGKALARLAREGAVRRVGKPHNPRSYLLIEDGHHA